MKVMVAVEVGVYVVLGCLAAYLAGVMPLDTFLGVAGFFGFGSIQTIRELFLEGSRVTRVVTVFGILSCAVWGYGVLTGSSFASVEQFGFLLAVVFGAQLTGLLRGAVRSRFTLRDGV